MTAHSAFATTASLRATPSEFGVFDYRPPLRVRRGGGFAAVFLMVFLAHPLVASEPDSFSLLLREAQGQVVVSVHPATGGARFVRAVDPNHGLPQPLGKQAGRMAQATAFLTRYGPAFGLTNPPAELRLVRRQAPKNGELHLSYEQVYRGVPVFGSFLRLHFDRTGTLQVVNGTVVPEIDLDPQPLLTRREAKAVAVRHGANLPAASSTPDGASPANSGRLVVWRDGLLQGEPGIARLAWEIPAVAPRHGAELVFIDAHIGELVARIDTSPEVMRREVYRDTLVAANLLWQEGDPEPFAGTGPAAEVSEVNDLIEYTADVYSFFAVLGEIDSWDGQGTTMQSVVDADAILVTSACPNARWNGVNTEYCRGITSDDTVGHEWGHAYTQAAHGLIYQWQSGALNESYSDIFGEAIDQLNGAGTDLPDGPRTDGSCSRFTGNGVGDSSYRWLMAEDTAAVTGQAFRDLWLPSCKGHPDRVGDSRYVCTTADNGGVHSNSGVPNHAFALLVDGGRFNGQNVPGVGLFKALEIYWRAMATASSLPTAGTSRRRSLSSARRHGHTVNTSRSCA